MDKKTKRDWILLTFFGVAMILMVVLLAIFGKSEPTNKEIQEYFERYMQQNGELGTGNAKAVEIPSEPKLFMMRATKMKDENGTVSIRYQQQMVVSGIPKDLRATYLDELNAVALITSEIYDTYTYTDGHKGFVLKYFVSLIDLTSNTIFAEDYFISGLPKSVKSRYEEDQYAPIPYASIHDWIKDYFSENSPLATQPSDTGASDPKVDSGLCWTFELSGYSGNRSEVWDTVVSSQVKQELTYDQFLDNVVEKNPGLKEDGYEFLSNKIYLLPVECQ